MKKLIYISLISLLISCVKNKSTTDEVFNFISGNWEYHYVREDIKVFTKNTYQFNNDQTFNLEIYLTENINELNHQFIIPEHRKDYIGEYDGKWFVTTNKNQKHFLTLEFNERPFDFWSRGVNNTPKVGGGNDSGRPHNFYHFDYGEIILINDSTFHLLIDNSYDLTSNIDVPLIFKTNK